MKQEVLCVAPRFSFWGGCSSPVYTGLFGQVHFSFIAPGHFIWRWRCLRFASVGSNKRTKGFFLLRASVCKGNCGYSRAFIGAMVWSLSVHKNGRRMDLLSEVALGLGIIRACLTVRNLVYFSFCSCKLQDFSSNFQGPGGFDELTDQRPGLE